MSDDLQALRAETEAALAAAADLRALDAVRVSVLGKSGSLSGLLKGLGGVPAEQRKERGAALNRLKAEVEALLEARRTALEAEALDARPAPPQSRPGGPAGRRSWSSPGYAKGRPRSGTALKLFERAVRLAADQACAGRAPFAFSTMAAKDAASS